MIRGPRSSLNIILNANIFAVSKVVIFGDPGMCYTSQNSYYNTDRNVDNGQALPNVASSKVDVYCHNSDNICVNGDLVLPAHLTYGINAAAAAAFVAS
jgi:cutinase